MSEWNDMSTHKLLFQIASTIKKKKNTANPVGQVHSRHRVIEM